MKTSPDIEWREVPCELGRRWILVLAGTDVPYCGEVDVADDEL